MMHRMKMHYLTYLFCLCLVLLAGCGSPLLSGPQQTSGRTDAFTILTSQKGVPISPSFIGMNIELTNLCRVLRMDTINQQAFEQLFKNLGVGILHVGGHSADLSSWQPDAKANCQDHPIVTKALVHALFDFAQRIHWNVIWGLNYLINKPHIAATEAAYVSYVGGNSLLGFTLGNEPEDLPKHGYRPTKWGYHDYITAWNANRDAVVARVPTARFFGPEACCQSGWLPSFVQDESASGVISAVTHHFYYYSGKTSKNANLSVDTLLSPQGMNQFTLQARGWVEAADRHGLPVDITELNTITNGGVYGISDTFGSALWGSDILLQAANQGINHIDFQEVPGAAYALINERGASEAIYNGLLFFHLATSSASLLPSVLNSTANVSAYALRGSDNTLRIVLINKTSQQPIKVTFTPGSSYHTMTTLRMQAASLTSTSGITIGNAAIAPNGSWNVPTLPRTTLHTTSVTLDVPVSSATLFTFSS